MAAQTRRARIRKGTDIPYITHAEHVSVILMRHGFREDLAIAGLLHKTAEDVGVELSTIEARFGPVAARLAAGVTEQKRGPDGRGLF